MNTKARSRPGVRPIADEFAPARGPLLPTWKFSAQGVDNATVFVPFSPPQRLSRPQRAKINGKPAGYPDRAACTDDDAHPLPDRLTLLVAALDADAVAN